MELVLVIVILTFSVSMYVTFLTAAAPKNNIILNVTLPREVQKDSRVLEITGKFKKVILLESLFLLAISSGIFLISQPSLILLLLCVWIVLTIFAGSRILSIYSKRLADLKVQNQWFVGKTHTITIDMEVSRVKEKMPVSQLWFLVPLAIAITLLIIGLITQELTIFPGLSALATTLLMFFAYGISSRERALAYTDDTEINLACHKVSIRMWTQCWVILATINSLAMAVISIFLGKPSTGILSASITLLIFSLTLIIVTHKRVQDTRNLLLERAESAIYVDDDYYWRGGFYNNPNDARTMVEKRFGIGYTINIATAKGKFAYYGLLIGLPALLLPLFLMLFSFDTAKFDMTITNDHVFIHAPMYKYDFPLDDVKSISTTDLLPQGSRTNGAATSRYFLGNFNLNQYGRSKMYTYRNQPPYIVLELPDLYVFFNADTPEKTREIYDSLINSYVEQP